MGDRPDITIPEEALDAAMSHATIWDTRADMRDAISAAAPLIVAANESAEIERLRTENDTLTEVMPCSDCGGTGIAPYEWSGLDAHGAPWNDQDGPCPRGCKPGPTALRQYELALEAAGFTVGRAAELRGGTQ